MPHPAERFVAPSTIMRGTPLKTLLNRKTVELIADSMVDAVPGFRRGAFIRQAMSGLESLELKPRAAHIAAALAEQFAADQATASRQLVASLGPELVMTEGNGLRPFFYLPHSAFIHAHVTDWAAGMAANYAITKRFSAEFALRPFLLRDPKRTLARLAVWASDANPHVRRLVSEGSRPRLPWAERIPDFMRDPSPLFPLLERLVDDPELYVRRSVANHLGDIAKNHPGLVFACAKRWLKEQPTPERCWVVRHAVRYHAKHGNKAAIALRKQAGGR